MIPAGDAFKDVKTVEYLANGAYARLRDNYGAENMLVADIQADYVNALTGYTNQYGEIYKWSFQQQDLSVKLTWENCYLTIAQCNFILDGIDAVYDSYDEAADLNRLELVRGRIHLIRAMSYSTLAERYCADYDAATAKKEFSGVPLLTTFSPADKPGRATLDAVYQLILEDIAAAKQRLAKQEGAADAIYLNRDCVTAFAAHVYLQMDMYPEALAAANSLIGNSAYALASSLEEFDDVWTYDRGKEIIFKFAASKTELAPTYAIPFFMDQYGGMGNEENGPNFRVWTPDYVPTQSLIDMYEKDDYRGKSWFYVCRLIDEAKLDMSTAGEFTIDPGYTLISKFPGNPDLRTSNSWNFSNTWKVFRLAEMYLIAAEAATHTGGDAKTPLNTLRTHRGLAELPAVTMTEIKAERYKELMLEGYRMTDLKRWGDGFKRGISQYATFLKYNPITQKNEFQKEDFISIPAARDLDAKAGDFHFVWPIPYDEIFANQNLRSQQNPGWER
ncbi:MAG: RagB/SusD family nutrient uptake outer membrane protein, partial [Acinetobacter sp.]